MPDRSAYRQPASELPGAQTLVRDPSGSKPPDTGTSDPNDQDYRDRPNVPNTVRERALPITPKVKRDRERDKLPAVYNVPPASKDAPGGKSLHKDRARTLGKPGEEDEEHPYIDQGNAPQRRRVEVTAEAAALEKELFGDREGSIYGKPFPPAQDRQRKQRGPAKTYFKKWYSRNKAKVRARMKRWYRRFRHITRYKSDQDRRQEQPERFERKPSGGYVRNKDRAKDDRQKRKEKDRGKSKSKKAALFLDPVPFIYIPENSPGLFQGVSLSSGMAHFHLMGGGLRMVPLDTFLEEALFTEEEDQEAVLDHLDAVFDFEGDEEEWDGEESDLDQRFEGWLTGDKTAGMTVRHRPQHRQRRQRGRNRQKSRQNYKKNRGRNVQRARLRRKRLKNNPIHKRNESIRKKNPGKFRRRQGHVLTAPQIAFSYGRGLVLGYVHGVSPMTGLVTFHLETLGEGRTLFQSSPVQDFLDQVVFLAEEDETAMFELIDAEVGDGAYADFNDPGADDLDDEDVDRFIYEDDNNPQEDPIYGQVALRVAARWMARQADFLYEKRPPDMEPGSFVDRGVDRKKLRRELVPLSKPEAPRVDQDPGNASKVIPYNHPDMVNNRAGMVRVAVRLSEIRDACNEGIHSRAGGLKVKLRRADARNALWLFDVQGSSDPYRVRVKAVRKGNVRDIKKADLKVSCSCPFWRWQGPEHWAKQRGYLYGRPRGQATSPDIKDPDGQHGACKHVLAVFNLIAQRYRVPQPPGKGRRWASSLRYLADIFDQGEAQVVLERPESELMGVVTRYRSEPAALSGDGRRS